MNFYKSTFALHLPLSFLSFFGRDTRATTEKAKGPSRRSSRAEKDTEEEVPDSGQRKRTARPGSAASNQGKATGEMGTHSFRGLML